MANNGYTLGRGKVYFSRFLPDTQTPEGYRYIGNTPEFSLTIESENLDHYSSDAGIREKDDSVPLEVNRTGGFTTDAIKPENIAFFFFGENSQVTIVADDVTDETITAGLGMSYVLGQTDSNPLGNRSVSAVIVANGATPVTAEGNYTVDAASGILHILPDAADITEGMTLTVAYSYAGGVRERIISGSEPVEGAMMYIANNPKGHDFHYILPWVKVTPNGDYALKGDEWQTIPFSLEVLKRTDQAAIYVDGAEFVR